MSRRHRYLSAVALMSLFLALAAPRVGVAAEQPAPLQMAEVGVFATWQDPRVNESSGLVWWRRHLFTINDSGGGPLVYVSPGRTGEISGVLRFGQANPRDTEAIAIGPHDTLWVADTGDNTASRRSISLISLRGKLTSGGPSSTRTFELTYPDGPRDAECLLVHPVTGRLYLVSKELSGGRVYEIPSELSTSAPNRLKYVATVHALVTDGIFAADGQHVFMRTYDYVTVYSFPGWRRISTTATPEERQGEGLALGPDGTLLASSEGTGTPVQQWRLRPEAFAAGEPQPTIEATPIREQGVLGVAGAVLTDALGFSLVLLGLLVLTLVVQRAFIRRRRVRR